jgi:small multidrug resistance pump
VKWLILFLGIACNAAASVLIKVAMLPPRRFSFEQPLSLLKNWPLCLGLVLYGSTFLLYTAALARLPLNVAHPILTAGAVATVALGSFVLLREPFPWTTTVGVGLVVVGVALISAGVS